MTTATATTRKPARETHGTCRLIATGNVTLAAALDSGDALLTIATGGSVTNYTVLRLTDKGRTVGYRLTKLTPYIVDRKVYDIDVTQSYGWQCDCPDAQFQNRECKHCRSLRAALASAGKIDVPSVKPEAKPAVVTPAAVDAESILEALRSMANKERRTVNGVEVERVGSGWNINGQYASDERRIRQLLGLPAKKAAPAPCDDLEDL